MVYRARLGFAFNKRSRSRRPTRGEIVNASRFLPTAKTSQTRWILKRKANPRRDYHEQEAQRVEASATLALSYPQLKGLTVELTYFDREIISWGQGVKYRANLEHARSVMRFHCPSAQCIGGGFDISEALADAVNEQKTKLTGESRCKGHRRLATGESAQCEATLHFKLVAAYQARPRTKRLKSFGQVASRRGGRKALGFLKAVRPLNAPRSSGPAKTRQSFRHHHT